MAREFEANELMSLPQKNGLGKYWEQRCLNVTDTVACKRKASTSERVVKSQRMYPENFGFGRVVSERSICQCEESC